MRNIASAFKCLHTMDQVSSSVMYFQQPSFYYLSLYVLQLIHIHARTRTYTNTCIYISRTSSGKNRTVVDCRTELDILEELRRNINQDTFENPNPKELEEDEKKKIEEQEKALREKLKNEKRRI